VTDPREDKEFEAFLAGDSRTGLTDHYEALGREEPPPEVDAHILATARDAAKVHRLGFGPRGGWLKPVALAATVLLSFSLVMNIIVDSPVRYEQVVTTSKEARAVFEDAPEGIFYDQDAPSLPPQLAMERMMTDQMSQTAIEEITVTARARSAEPQDVPIAVSVSVLRPEAQSIAQDAALLIVAEYVATAEMVTGAGRIPLQAMELRTVPRAETPGRAVSSPAATDQDVAPTDEVRGEDDPESMLREIARLNAGGSRTVAGDRLDEFLARYPDHPVSIKISEQGN